MAIRFSDEAQKQVIASMRRHCAENLDDDIGDLKADLLLDYFLKEIGPTVYNQAILDAQAYFQEKTSDLDASHFEVEFGYWV